MSEQKRSLYKKFHSVQQALQPLEKNGKNTTQRYSYTTASDVLEPVRAACGEQGLVITLSVIDKHIEPGRASCTVELSVIDVESGESFSNQSPGYAEDWSYKENRPCGDKAIYKAITGATKYAVRSLFCLPAEDDADKARSNGKDTKSVPSPHNRQHKGRTASKVSLAAVADRPTVQPAAKPKTHRERLIEICRIIGIGPDELPTYFNAALQASGFESGTQCSQLQELDLKKVFVKLMLIWAVTHKVYESVPAAQNDLAKQKQQWGDCPEAELAERWRDHAYEILSKQSA